MHYRKSVYNILIVSSTDSFTSVLTDLFPKSKYSSYTVNNIRTAKQVLEEKNFDFIIINSPLPDGEGVPLAIDICNTRQTIVLFVIKESMQKAMHDTLSPYGIFTLPKPTSRSTLIQVMAWMESARERLRQLEQKSISLEEKLLELRLINRAKWILISEQQMSEAEAHRYIEKQSMDCCLPKKFIAENIIQSLV